MMKLIGKLLGGVATAAALAALIPYTSDYDAETDTQKTHALLWTLTSKPNLEGKRSYHFAFGKEDDPVIEFRAGETEAEAAAREAEEAQMFADDLQAEAEKKNVHLSVSGEPAELEGVRQLIYEVAYNLGDNAIKYNIDGGSVSINVSSDGKNAKLTVSDTGIGIAAEDQSRIFERFYRVDKSHSKESGGTGLGLSIVKHAVQYHGGRISMDSAPGKGTSISVSLPIQ